MTDQIPSPDPELGLGTARLALRRFFIVARAQEMKPAAIHRALIEAVATTGSALERVYPHADGPGGWNAHAHEALDRYWAACRASDTSVPERD